MCLCVKLTIMKWKELVTGRSDWRDLCYNAVNQFEERRIDCAKNHRTMMKARSSANTTSTTPTAYICSTCGRDCSSQIGLLSHNRRHRCDSSFCRRLSPGCLSVCVCPQAHPWNRWTDLYEIWCADPLWPLFGPPHAALRYVVYFRFYE